MSSLLFINFVCPIYKLLPNVMVYVRISKLRMHSTSMLTQKCTFMVVMMRNFEDMMRRWHVVHSSSIPRLWLNIAIASSRRTDPLVHLLQMSVPPLESIRLVSKRTLVIYAVA